MTVKAEFGVLILTYGRPDRVYTYESLRKQGYTGPIYLVCSTDDQYLADYQRKYGKQVIVFNKDDVRGTFDIGDNKKADNVVVFARNIAFAIAKRLQLKYFLEVDDDYVAFLLRVPNKGKLDNCVTANLDKVFATFVTFLKTTGVHSIALAQGGDYMGGVQSQWFSPSYVPQKRKVMNCFFNAVDRPYQFFGRINEDVNCYIQNGKTGMVFLTHPLASVNQVMTQTNPGGLTEFYLSSGTYVKSFYTVMYNPSAVRIRTMGRSFQRLHHNISWRHAVPCLIREGYRKPALINRELSDGI